MHSPKVSAAQEDLYTLLAHPAGGPDEPGGPDTPLTATIETIDNDRAIGALLPGAALPAQ